MIDNIAAIEIPERNSLANLACQNVHFVKTTLLAHFEQVH